ncbi:MAG TPA: hypothetical protein VHY35_12700 [Stellaceae bacterium]|jgi:hypothetical protein|nr:hypothetical protein [Stellaceae bacterium]
MLSSEWGELATVFDHMATLLDRYSVGRRSRNVAVLEGLERDITAACGQQQRLLKHIAAQQSSIFSRQWCEGRTGSMLFDEDDAPRPRGEHAALVSMKRPNREYSCGR